MNLMPTLLTDLTLFVDQRKRGCPTGKRIQLHPTVINLSTDLQRVIRLYNGLSHIPDVDTATSTVDDTSFARPKQPPVWKISVNMLTDDWLSTTLDKLNMTLVEGLSSRSSKDRGLQHDQFIKTTISQEKWYGLHTDKDKSFNTASF